MLFQYHHLRRHHHRLHRHRHLHHHHHRLRRLKRRFQKLVAEESVNQNGTCQNNRRRPCLARKGHAEVCRASLEAGAENAEISRARLHHSHRRLQLHHRIYRRYHLLRSTMTQGSRRQD